LCDRIVTTAQCAQTESRSQTTAHGAALKWHPVTHLISLNDRRWPWYF